MLYWSNSQPAEPLIISHSCCVQVWLQEFAWTEAEKEERLHVRCSSNACCSAEDRSNLSNEPMFCMETAMNMLYWSALVYDYEEVRMKCS